MLNQVVLVGRLTKNSEVKEMEGGKKISFVTVAVPRSFKDVNGEYQTDFIECVLWDSIAQNTAEYCHKGDIIGIKGRLQTDNYEKEDGEKVFKTEVIAEKVTFLSSRKSNEEGNEEE